MEPRKLTKEDIDKVRDIEGFPIGTDEDIIALSDAPYYTACPNPFIEEFIRENGTPYDEETDDYHREPFAADVSEGKNDPIYNAHSYHTKVPYKAIMRYILHYTKPGDIVFDGFCGTGMTGVAAQKCGSPDLDFKTEIESVMPEVQWGERKAIINDLAVAGSYISANYNLPFDIEKFNTEVERVISESMDECGWMYETTKPNQVDYSLLVNDSKGVIFNTVWSSVLLCPNCGRDFVFYTEGVDENGKVKSKIRCPHCGAVMTKNQAIRKEDVFYDELTDETISRASQVPVFKIYKYNGQKYQEPVNDYDMDVLAKIDAISLLDKDIPAVKMLFKDGRWGDIYRTGYHKGYTHTHHFYTKRNLLALASIYRAINRCKKAKKEGGEKTPKEKKELSDEEKEYKSMRKKIQEKLIKFATRVPVFMYLTDYRERSLKDVITQLEPGLFKKVTGLDVKDFELLCSLGVFNANLMNDAIFKFKRYEDSSLTYTGIDKHEGKDIGGWDTVIKRAEYDQLFYNQQATMEAPTVFEVPQVEDIPVPAKKPTVTSTPVPTPTVTPAKPKPTPSVTAQYGVKPAVSAAAKPAAKQEEFVAPDVKDGSIVLHKAFGEGTVTKIDKAQKHIRVTFGVGEKTFIFPDAFKQGFLKMKGE